MTTIRMSVMENYGNVHDESGEEVQWGPYVSYHEMEKAFADLTAEDIVSIPGFTLDGEDGDDQYLTFDLTRELDTGAYCRLNYLITEEPA